MKKITVEHLLQKAKHHLFVHRYSWTHEARRKLARRMCKDGLLELVGQTKDGFFYRLPRKNHDTRS